MRLFLENCPNCDAMITWNRKEVCYCRYCNFDWRQSVPQIVPEDEVRTVKHLYSLFNLPHGNHVPLPHVLRKLNVEDTLAAIFLILAQLQGITDTKGKVLSKFFENNNQFHIKLRL